MITYEVIADRDRFEDIGPAWQTLWMATSQRAFQSFDWVRAWFAQTDGEYRLLIGIAWDGTEPAAILPFTLHRYHGVQLMEWAGQSLCDYCDGFGDAGLFADLWGAVLNAGKPDIIRLKNIAPDAKIRPLLSTQQYLAEAQEDVCLLVQSHWPTGEAWFRTLNKKKRNNHARGRRKLEEIGTVEIVISKQVDRDLLLRLFELKRTWLIHNNLDWPFLSKGPDFLIELAGTLESAQKLCMFCVKCNGTIVAGSMNIIEGERMLAFFAGYDPQYDVASPGIMLMNEYTRWAFDQGYREIDYLRGAELYKFEFANATRMLSAFVGGKTLTGKAVLKAFQLKQRWDGRAEQQPALLVGAAYLTQAGTPRLQSEG
jgi:CelD/BcsL family acetyltransferase involved in cellulose biosynthesis